MWLLQFKSVAPDITVLRGFAGPVKQGMSSLCCSLGLVT
jgi:hypothetical protein